MGLLSIGIHSEAPGPQLLCLIVPVPEGTGKGGENLGRNRAHSGLALIPSAYSMPLAPIKELSAKYPNTAGPWGPSISYKAPHLSCGHVPGHPETRKRQ